MLNLDNLNQAQRKAVMHGEGPLLVLAGPGSGKTFTITQRIFYLLERKNIAPENILVITFTKESALSMQSRFQEASERTLPVNFGTFHSVFYHILRESHYQKLNQILKESQKKKMILPVIKQYLSKEELQYRQNELAEEAVLILSAISYFKNTGDRKMAERQLPDIWKENFYQIFQDYERERRQQGAIDFDDMLYECRRVLMQDQGLREYWQERFRHILVDEFQDINPMQYEVIRLLLSEPYNLFAVGDDDQSIYGFRGAKPDCLKQFVQDYHAKQITLNINYRCRKEIMKASMLVIDENKERFPKQMKVSPEKERAEYNTAEAVKLCSFEEREQQYQYLITQLRNQTREIHIGVLFRTNAYMQGLATRLSKEGISYFMKEKATSIYEHFIVKDIVAYLMVASGMGNRAMFLQIMNKPSRYISRDSLGMSEGMPDYRNIIQYYRQKGLDSTNMQVIWNLEKWEKQMKYLSNLSPFLAVQYISKVIGYDKYLKERSGANAEQLQEWEELLQWLSTDAANYGTTKEWLAAQELYTRKLEKKADKIKWEGESGRKKEEPIIILMTVHAAKGLEFDKVYIPDCNEKIFPHGNMPDEKECEEERRLFYVAMTRAKESLEILYLTGTKERPRLLSRFLNRLIRTYSSTNSSNSQLSRYSS